MRLRFLFFFALGFHLAVSAFPATAPTAETGQDAPSNGDQNTSEPIEDVLILDEVVVTAQRRDQSQQEVPVSVTSFSGEDLELRSLDDAAGLLSLTPNVSSTS